MLEGKKKKKILLFQVQPEVRQEKTYVSYGAVLKWKRESEKLQLYKTF